MARRTYARDLLGEDADRSADRSRALGSFREFVNHWQFLDRESGRYVHLREPWPGQVALIEAVCAHPWVIGLKAGKLGFTEVGTAFAAFRALSGPPNARVHIFSKDANAAEDLLQRLRFSLRQLPIWLRPRIADDLPGGSTATSLKLRMGPADIRTIVSYAAGANASIDQTAHHVHVDELAHMTHGEQTWAAVQSTIAPSGTVLIVSRGAGPENVMATLWDAATDGQSRLHPLFQAWNARPDRDHAWRQAEGMSMTAAALARYLPETPEDAIASSNMEDFISAVVWDNCFDATLPPLMPGDKTSLVLGVDLALTNDTAAVVAVSRHPQDSEMVAIRAVRIWKPNGGQIPLMDIERFIRLAASGGCGNAHPRLAPDPDCQLCRGGRWDIPKHNVVCVVYDPFQAVLMAQQLERQIWCVPFSQGADREQADVKMQQLALTGRLRHQGQPDLREHVLNAALRISPDGSRGRIMKRSERRKVDAAVAASMAIDRCLYLNM